MADANTYISASHCEPTTKPTKVTNHQRTTIIDGKTVKIIQKTTSESLRLSMSNNPFDGSVVNSNSNGTIDTSYCSGGGGGSVGGGGAGGIDTVTANNILVGQQYQHQHQQPVYGQRPIASSLPTSTTTATLLMTNNGKLVQSSASPPFVTLSDIGMDLKPKPSSYQITSITVGTRTSADDDSADDLDESHTTDENSRVTDMENETPSYSEDTYSKDDVFAAAYAHGMVPIIQKSADLSNCVNNNVNNTNNNNINSSLNNNNNNNNNAGNSGNGGGGGGGGNGGAKKMSAGEVRVSVATTVDKNKGVEIKGSERFKVVKIESIEPFKRGRWTCMDYLDQSAKQLQMNFGAGNGAAGGGSAANASVGGGGGGNGGAGGPGAAAPKNVTTSDSGVVLTDNFHCDASAAMLNNNMNSNLVKKKPVKVVQTDMMPTQLNQSAVPVNHVVGQSAPVAIQTIETNMSPGQTLQQPLNAVHMNQTHVDAATMLANNQQGHIAYAANVTTANTFQPANAIQPGQSLPQQQLHQLLSQQAQGVSISLGLCFLLIVLRIFPNFAPNMFSNKCISLASSDTIIQNPFKFQTATGNADANAVGATAVCQHIVGWQSKCSHYSNNSIATKARNPSISATISSK